MAVLFSTFAFLLSDEYYKSSSGKSGSLEDSGRTKPVCCPKLARPDRDLRRAPFKRGQQIEPLYRPYDCRTKEQLPGPNYHNGCSTRV